MHARCAACGTIGTVARKPRHASGADLAQGRDFRQAIVASRHHHMGPVATEVRLGAAQGVHDMGLPSRRLQPGVDGLAGLGFLAQDHGAAARCGRGLGSGRTGRPFERNRHGERRTNALHALHGDTAAHQFAKPGADGKPEARPPMPAGGPGVSLHERLEHPRDQFGRHADAGIQHAAHQRGLAARIGADLGGQRDLAAGGELERVAEQIVDDLRQPGPVAHQQGIERRHQVGMEADRPVRRQRREGQRHAFQLVYGPERRRGQRHLAGVDLGEIQDVVDDAPQALRRRVQRAQARRVGLQALVARQQLQVAEQRIQRRADLVAHRRKEVRTGAHHRLGGALRGAQFVLDLLLRRHVLDRAEQHVFLLIAGARMRDLEKLLRFVVRLGVILRLPRGHHHLRDRHDIARCVMACVLPQRPHDVRGQPAALAEAQEGIGDLVRCQYHVVLEPDDAQPDRRGADQDMVDRLALERAGGFRVAAA
ncbi:hypothetical protein D3C81_737610 [compost metagenome]